MAVITNTLKIIDLRSDTVTKPSQPMLNAMMNAEVGDDVFGEDPTVQKLEAMIAERADMEAAIFAPSGTQTNLLGIMSHCARGDEYIVGQTAHKQGIHFPKQANKMNIIRLVTHLDISSDDIYRIINVVKIYYSSRAVE